MKFKRKCLCCNGSGYVFHAYKHSQDKLRKEILKLYKQGLGIREIARLLDITSPYTVSYYLKTVNELKKL